MLRLSKSKLIHVVLAIFLLSDSVVMAMSPAQEQRFVTDPSPQRTSIGELTTDLQSEAGMVSITDSAFTPATITVSVGTEVTWVNSGSVTHGVSLLSGEKSYDLYLPIVLKQSSNASPDVNRSLSNVSPGLKNRVDGKAVLWTSGPMLPGGTFIKAFNTVGTFTYINSEAPEMTGTVVVEEANEAPVVTILNPLEGTTVGVGSVQVSGTTADDGTVVELLVNGVPAIVSGGTFQAIINLESGNQTIIAEVKDDDGTMAVDGIIVLVDGQGPVVEVMAPRDRQAVYTLQPFLEISYSDFGDAVDTSTFLATLTRHGGGLTDVTGNLAISGDGASGTINSSLIEDSSYTLATSIEDTLGNSTLVTTTFYVPLNPTGYSPPHQVDGDGSVSGMVYDSSSCDADLTQCSGLAGARVTVQSVQVQALAQLRAQRQRQTLARLASYESFSALDPLSVSNITAPISGTAITGPDGFFTFPLAETGIYWLRVEKDGFTYGQRELSVVRERSSTANDVYLTPIDPVVTPCDDSGCFHSNSDGSIKLDIPAGAIGAGQAVSVTATLFDNVEFLPSGELPEGTWETYALNLGGASEITFTVPVTLQLQNELGFTAGITIPLGYWNQNTQQWEHAGEGVVDGSGQWVETNITHFSNYDLNFPVFLSDIEIDVGGDEFDDEEDRDEPGDEKDKKCAAGSSGCFINFKSGTLHEWLDTPAVEILGRTVSQQLSYSTDRANPSEVIDLRVSLKNTGSIQSFGYMGYELYIQGEKTATHYVPVDLNATGELGRFRYYWDGRNAQGDLQAPGAYQYQVKFTFPYLAEYCRPVNGIFGNEPDCINGSTGRFVEAQKVLWQDGTVVLHGDKESPYGIGWVLGGQQQLYENEAGDVVIVDGANHDEFYFPQKDQLRASEVALDAAPGSSYSASADSRDGRQETDKPAFWREAQDPAPREAFDEPLPLPTMPDVPPYSEQRGRTASASLTSTNVCGAISSNTTWSSANSPHIVTCDVSVAAGVSLTIEPGVSVRFQAGFSLVVAGDLSASGVEPSPIRFESAGAQVPGSWNQIAFLAGSSGTLDQVIVSHGGYDTVSSPQFGAITIASDDVSLTQSTLTENGVAIYITGGAAPTISDSTFFSNTARYGAAIFSTGDAAAVIEGNQFIGNSATDSGGAIYVLESSATIRANQFYSNTTGGSGGAINVNWLGAATIIDNHFEGNSARYGGATFIYNEIERSSVISNTFVANHADSQGGALHDESHQGLIRGNDFFSNTARTGGALSHYDYFNSAYSTIVEDNNFIAGNARDGGGIYLGDGDPLVRNNIFANNVADYGGAMEFYGAPRLVHNVMWNNLAQFGGGIANYESDALPQIYNNIIVSNTATFTNANGYLGGGGIYNGTGLNYVPLGDHNVVWGNAGLDYQEVLPGPNDISADPLFVDPANLDFHLQPGSPAIDAGDPAIANGDDFEGDQRPMGLAPDVGVDEFPAFGVSKQTSSASFGPGETVTYVVRLYNPENQMVTASVTDVLPGEFSFESYLSPAFSCVHDGATWGGSLNCTGDVNAGGQESITVTLNSDVGLSAPVHTTNIITATAGSAVARDQNDVWLSWCRVQLNDGPIGDDIHAAIKASKDAADVIKVSGRCLVPEGVGIGRGTLQGGWDQEFNIRFPALYTTTLDAVYQGSVLEAQGTATVEGFVLTHGVDSGVVVRNSAIIQNSIVEHNIEGGVWVADSATVRNNIIRYNQSGAGGGIYVRTEDNNLLVDGNLIINNYATGAGGGIAVRWKGRVQNNIIVDNHTDGDGGGLQFGSRNRNPIIEHNTFWGNSAGIRGGGVALTSEFGWLTSDIIRNNAVISNTAPTGGGIFLTSPMVGLDYNNVWGNSGDDYNAGAAVAANDISADPRFVDAYAGDFHILPDSPMIDAADPLSDFYPDYDGDPRPMGEGGSDIGADEFPARTAFSRTATDYSRLEYDPGSGTYSRIYLDRTLVHFNADNRHDFTLSPDGTRMAYGYNPDGSVDTVMITPPGGGAPQWTWSFAYTNDRLATITDPAGRTTQITIDDNNHLTGAALADGATRSFIYNGYGLLSQQRDENRHITDYQYDDYGRLNKVIDPPREVYDPQTGTASIMREVRTLTSSDTGYQLLNHHDAGSPTTPGATVPKSWQLVDKMTFGRGSISGRTDRWGLWAAEIDGLGRESKYFRNLDGSIQRAFDPEFDCVEYDYDENGNKIVETHMAFSQCIKSSLERDPDQLQRWIWTYESRFNQVKSEMDPNGNTTHYLYDYEVGAGDAGRLVQITYPEVDDGSGALIRPVEKFVYNGWGLLDSEIDPLGTVTKYIYTKGKADEASDGAEPLFAPGVVPVPGLLTQVIRDYGGENLTNTYREFDGAGNPGLTKGPGGHEESAYRYDAMNRLVHQSDAVGVVTTFGYDGRGNEIQRIIDSGGKDVTTDYAYDANDQLISQWTDDGTVIVGASLMYDINRKPVLQEDGRGSQKVYLYDDADQLINVIDPAGYVMTYTYTLDGKQSDVVDASGSSTHYDYDGVGRRITETVDVGGLELTTSYGYDLKGNKISETDPTGTITCFEYDALDRLTAEVQDCGGLELRNSFTYDLNGNILTATDPRGIVNRHEYDALNRETLVVMDNGGRNLEGRYEYDSAGNLATVLDERGYLHTMAYDLLNRTTELCEDANNLNLCSSYAYDTLGNRSSSTDPEGTKSITSFNGFGLQLEVIADSGGLASRTQYNYDNALNKTQATDANGNVTSYTYGGRNDLLAERDADGTTVTYSYEARGFALTRTNQDGDVTNHQYDGAGRLLQKSFSTGGIQEYAYDAANRMTSAAETANGHQTLVRVGYSPIGDIISTTDTVDNKSWSTGYEYDHAAGVYTLTYPSGVQRVRDLESLGRIQTVRDGSGVLIAGYEYQDAAGYGTIAYANGNTNRSEFDALGRITRVSSDVGDYRYGYDGAGNRTFMQRAHQNNQPADVYQYDTLYRPVQVWYGADATDPANIVSSIGNHQFALDALANRLETNRDGAVEAYGPNDGQQLTNPMNRYELVAGTVITYDIRGNTLNDGLNAYSYDILNRQVGVNGPGGNSEYVYNALGLRVATIVDGLTTYFVYDIDKQVLEERAANDALLARYTYGMGIDFPLMMERAGESYYYHRDAQGSITELTDSSGALVERYEYDIYGTARIFDAGGSQIAATAVGNPYLYTARRYDPESGNYTFRARMYSPTLGRFLQMDPLGYVDGMNLYASYFVINATDPTGMSVEMFSACIAAVIGACLSIEIESDFKPCCKSGQKLNHGRRSYKAKISTSIGFGIGGELMIAGIGVSLNLKGPRLEGELNYTASNSVCGGKIDTDSVCQVRGINVGTTGSVGALGFTISYDAKIQGKFSICASSSNGKISAEAKFCGTKNIEINYQIAAYKGNIWKHKSVNDTVCDSIASASWALPG